MVVDTREHLARVGVRRDRLLGEETLRGHEPLLGFVAEPECPLTRLAPRRHRYPTSQARVRYSPVRVSTFSVSPVSTNSGTCTTRPVSSVAGLRAPDTR